MSLEEVNLSKVMSQFSQMGSDLEEVKEPESVDQKRKSEVVKIDERVKKLLENSIGEVQKRLQRNGVDFTLIGVDTDNLDELGESNILLITEALNHISWILNKTGKYFSKERFPNGFKVLYTDILPAEPGLGNDVVYLRTNYTRREIVGSSLPYDISKDLMQHVDGSKPSEWYAKPPNY